MTTEAQSQTDGNPVALVTGSGKGIGRATALAFAAAGYDVIVSDLNRADAERTEAEIVTLGHSAVAVECDVRDPGSVERMVSAGVERFGRLDAAVNNAGLGIPAVTAADLTEDGWDLVLDTNLKGVWLSMKYEIPAMLSSGSGAIVNIASIFGLVGFDDISPAYVASKHGVVGLTRSTALQYATKSLRVNAVCPATVDTPAVRERAARTGGMEYMEAWQPMNRVGQPEEIAAAAVWLCSDGASYITGATLAVDGGYTAR